VNAAVGEGGKNQLAAEFVTDGYSVKSSAHINHREHRHGMQTYGCDLEKAIRKYLTDAAENRHSISHQFFKKRQLASINEKTAPLRRIIRISNIYSGKDMISKNINAAIPWLV